MKKLICDIFNLINRGFRAKKFLLISICILNLISFEYYSQNLIQNSSFETFIACPTSYSQINKCSNWYDVINNNIPPDATDFLNTCGTNQDCSVPINVWGNQTPLTGNAYVGMVTKASIIGSNYRENIYTILSTALIPNITYSLTMNVSLAENAKYASNNFGFKFSKVPNFPVNNSSHFNNSNVITNNNGWSVITGTFTADSAYTHLAIGNFYDDANTTEIVACLTCTLNVNYYYIDDISVIKLGETTGLENIEQTDLKLILSPNPTNGIIHIEQYKESNKQSNLTIYDILGNQIKYFDDIKNHIDISDLQSGIYYTKFIIDGTVILNKIIKE